MFPKATYVTRRTRLAESVPSGLILLPGNGEVGMNYVGNTYAFRQDSNFRYFAGHDRPDLVLTIDAGSGESRLYGDDLTLGDVIWMGEHPGVKELADRIGATYGGSLDALAGKLGRGGVVHYLPPYRAQRSQRLLAWLGSLPGPSDALIRGVIALRSVKDRDELAEMDRAVQVSMDMHRTAQRMAAPGMLEAAVAGQIEGMALAHGGGLAYPAIVTRNGHILHNHYHGNELRAGDLLLIDAGAQTTTGYAGDITRTFAVGEEMSGRQGEIYTIVDGAKRRVIEEIRPGVPYRELHDRSARIIVEGLKDLGLMKGDTDGAVARGAHALFYPHGLGHLIGLDVHDMEDLGEDLVGYDEEYRRSEQFGTRNLRLGRRLREGFALTVEPGIYFIPVLIDKWREEGKHADYIDYGAVAAYRDFGGIRLEDNVVVTADNCRTLGSV